jgi:hypothetical protein
MSGVINENVTCIPPLLSLSPFPFSFLPPSFLLPFSFFPSLYFLKEKEEK